MKRSVPLLSLGVMVATGTVLVAAGLFANGASASRVRSPAEEPTLGLYADKGPVDVPDGMWFDATTGTLRDDTRQMDAQRVAQSAGIGVSDASARLDDQGRMAELLTDAQRRFPDLVGVRWVDGRAIAQFKGRAEPGALEMLRSTGAQVEYELVRYSASELDQVQMDLGEFLQSVGAKGFVLAVDPTAQRIVASVSMSGITDPAISRQSIVAALPAHLAEANLDIQVVDGPIAQPATTYGGTDAGNSTSYYCTNGFTVIAGSTNGVASDGHCDAMTKYRDWVTGVTHTMVRADWHIGSWGDFAWFTTSGTEVDDFYSDELGNRRDVTGVRSTVSQGDEVLWFERRTRNDWLSWVEYPSVSTSGPSRLACLHNSHVQNGDSGGPVYLYGEAIGLVWGWVNIDGARRDCFSQARYIDNAIGVTVKN